MNKLIVGSQTRLTPAFVADTRFVFDGVTPCTLRVSSLALVEAGVSHELIVGAAPVTVYTPDADDCIRGSNTVMRLAVGFCDAGQKCLITDPGDGERATAMFANGVVDDTATFEDFKLL